MRSVEDYLNDPETTDAERDLIWRPVMAEVGREARMKICSPSKKHRKDIYVENARN